MEGTEWQRAGGRGGRHAVRGSACLSVAAFPCLIPREAGRRHSAVLPPIPAAWGSRPLGAAGVPTCFSSMEYDKGDVTSTVTHGKIVFHSRKLCGTLWWWHLKEWSVHNHSMEPILFGPLCSVWQEPLVPEAVRGRLRSQAGLWANHAWPPASCHLPVPSLRSPLCPALAPWRIDALEADGRLHLRLLAHFLTFHGGSLGQTLWSSELTGLTF